MQENGSLVLDKEIILFFIYGIFLIGIAFELLWVGRTDGRLVGWSVNQSVLPLWSDYTKRYQMIFNLDVPSVKHHFRSVWLVVMWLKLNKSFNWSVVSKWTEYHHFSPDIQFHLGLRCCSCSGWVGVVKIYLTSFPLWGLMLRCYSHISPYLNRFFVHNPVKMFRVQTDAAVTW